RLALRSTDARDASNRTVALDPASGTVAPAASGLAMARPSPFRDRTTLECALAREGRMTLAIYGIDGRRIRTVADGLRGAGVHRLEWDGRDDAGRSVAAGMYFARLTTVEGRYTRTLVLVP